jgi:exosortase C (VPDSG-CTERM-specific)
MSHFAIYAALLTLAFAWPLLDLVRFAFGGRAALPVEISNLYTHIVLIPFIALYLARLRWKESPLGTVTAGEGAPARGAAFGFGLLGLALVGVAVGVGQGPNGLSRNDWLTLMVCGWVSGLTAGGCWFLGLAVMRRLWFSFVFLLLLAPIPTFLIQWINQATQHASAAASYWMIRMTGTAIFRDGLLFYLPGITLEVAEECSGIRSTLVLFITSLIAGQMFLRRPWKQVVLTLFVIPLAIVRNGFRILTIAWLCVHVDPDLIHSWIHKRGGPLFFALSLVPFFAMLLWLRMGEGQSETSQGHTASSASAQPLSDRRLEGKSNPVAADVQSALTSRLTGELDTTTDH